MSAFVTIRYPLAEAEALVELNHAVERAPVFAAVVNKRLYEAGHHPGALAGAAARTQRAVDEVHLRQLAREADKL